MPYITTWAGSYLHSPQQNISIHHIVIHILFQLSSILNFLPTLSEALYIYYIAIKQLPGDHITSKPKQEETAGIYLFYILVEVGIDWMYLECELLSL